MLKCYGDGQLALFTQGDSMLLHQVNGVYKQTNCLCVGLATKLHLLVLSKPLTTYTGKNSRLSYSSTTFYKI